MENEKRYRSCGEVIFLHTSFAHFISCLDNRSRTAQSSYQVLVETSLHLILQQLDHCCLLHTNDQDETVLKHHCYYDLELFEILYGNIRTLNALFLIWIEGGPSQTQFPRLKQCSLQQDHQVNSFVSEACESGFRGLGLNR